MPHDKVRAMRWSFSAVLWLFGLAGALLSGCGTMDMRKILLKPQQPDVIMRQSSLKAGLVLDETFTGYTYTFKTGPQIFLLASVAGSIDIGKNLSQAVYSIVSSKFGNVVVARGQKELADVELYFVPRIVAFEYSPPFTGYSSHTADIILATDVYSGSGVKQTSFTIKQHGSRSNMAQLAMESNYEMAEKAVNEAVANLLRDFADDLNRRY